ncbi:LIM-domain binding protein-domain-containing protein [Lobosporangium transversale]|uniref:LIM-domain binding protein-domain-containing protein n=1 Tax=Lobosporangium transversale TaxID=64571 RepID=A0A1Y2GVQ6_9FUNG|nr:LIM-domain binding protein-domain-containing protein [Lobosporangium transversale]ORZ23865.1 LIM-domain binding protein-domain-containing protein [Lobosporangium transversale]|eukprot:XP_021883679.1 LIM-domain binding protein-domain-containing protein [Lobosporangium transversale]
MCSPMQRNVIQSALQAPSSLDPIITDERSSRALLRLMEFGRAIGLNIEVGLWRVNSLYLFDISSLTALVLVSLCQHQTIDFWQAFVAKFFGNAGKLRYKLVNPVTSESKVFELTAPSLPRFYLGTVESGIKQLQLILEQALGQTAPFPLIVECPRITLVSHHINGSKIFAKGTIKATFATDFKFDLLELTSLGFEEFISRPVDETLGSPLLESKIEGKKKGNMKRALTTSKKATQSIPESIVNEFGITHKAMRLLEVGIASI